VVTIAGGGLQGLGLPNNLLWLRTIFRETVSVGTAPASTRTSVRFGFDAGGEGFLLTTFGGLPRVPRETMAAESIVPAVGSGGPVE